MNVHRIKVAGAAAALTAVMAIPGAALADSHEAEGDAMENAMVRVGHFSPDAPNVDVYAGDAAILSDVPFGVISDYLEVPGATHAIAVVAAGADLADGAVIGPVDLTFEAGTKTTVAATNSLEDIEAQVLLDEPTPNADGTQVRIVHFSADAPAVDVAPDGAEALVFGLAYPEDTGYVDLPAAEYDLEIRAAGSEDVAFDIDPLALDAGNSYSAFAIGSLADGTFMVLPALDASVEMMEATEDAG